MNKVEKGDCLEIMNKMEDKSVDHTVTDIPYDVVSRESNGLRKFDKEQADELGFALDDFVNSITKVTKETIFIFCASEQVSKLIQLLGENDFEADLAIWEKSNPSPVNGQYIWLSGVECCVVARAGCLTDELRNVIWRFPNGRSKTHPTEKPMALMSHIITHYTQPNDIIFDPCAGSGSTLEAAAINQRQWWGVELFDTYYNFIETRMSRYG